MAALGGSERTGQIEMAEAVAHAFDTGEHLAVQAGTGTGKSLGYLVPALALAASDDDDDRGPVVVSTATIALQRQLVDRDLPRLTEALAGALPRKPSFALLKGRGNYLCLNKIHNGSAAEDPPGQDELFEPFAATALGRDVQRLTAWAEETKTGDRDELRPGVPDRAWTQVSVSARECIGVARCPFSSECFSEKARAKAALADVVVTNHALLAIDAIADAAVLPEHGHLVVDEAHELVDRVTSVATAELTSTALSVAMRRAGRLIGPELSQRLEAASATFGSAIHDATPGRIDYLDDETGHLPVRAARRRARRPRRRQPVARRPAGRRGPLRGDRRAGRDRRHRRADPCLVRTADPRPHRRGVARGRRNGIPCRRRSAFATGSSISAGAGGALRAARGAVVGGRAATVPAVRTVDDSADVGDAEHRRLVRRDGGQLGPDGSRHRSNLAGPGCGLAVRTCHSRNPLRRSAFAPARP